MMAKSTGEGAVLNMKYSQPLLGFAGFFAILCGLSVDGIAQTVTASSASRVIPPGQEEIVRSMLTIPKATLDKTGCRPGDIKISRSSITTGLACPATHLGSIKLSITLRHKSSPDQANRKNIRSAKFLLSIPSELDKPLLDSLQETIRSNEAAFRWVIAAGQAGSSGTLSDLPSAPATTKSDDPLYRRYMKGFALYRKKQHVKAFEYFHRMAREHVTYSGVLGMLVANLAPQRPDRARVQEFVDLAKKGNDPLAQFIAGVAAHYSAHYRATSKQEKGALYKLAISHLERTLKPYSFEPRVYIYLAVSHFRLGHQEKAEALIETAVKLNRKDPDAYYCRAEIYHRTQHDRAIADIDRYLALTDKTTVSSGKVGRVKKMRAYLIRVKKGQTKLTELWDPIMGHTYELPAEAEAFKDSGRSRILFLGMLAIVLVGGLLIWRRSRRSDQPSV